MIFNSSLSATHSRTNICLNINSVEIEAIWAQHKYNSPNASYKIALVHSKEAWIQVLADKLQEQTSIKPQNNETEDAHSLPLVNQICI